MEEKPAKYEEIAIDDQKTQLQRFAFSPFSFDPFLIKLEREIYMNIFLDPIIYKNGFWIPLYIQILYISLFNVTKHMMGEKRRGSIWCTEVVKTCNANI